jgi:hypothetical protein
MLMVRRMLCVAYWGLLTVLLLVPHPMALLGISRLPTAIPNRGVHFVLFLILSLLVHGSRWPIRPAVFVQILVAYAVASELLQSLFPPRTVELLDLLENLLGIATGTLLSWWLAIGRHRVVPPTGGTN